MSVKKRKRRNRDLRTNSMFAMVFILVMILFGGFSIIGFLQHRISGTAINEDYENAEDPFEAEFNGTFFLKEGLIDLQGSLNKAQEAPELNGVVKLTNGYLTPVMKPLSDEEKEVWRQEAENLNSLATYFKIRNIPFLYAVTPDKVAPADQEQYLPEGYEDYSNEHIDYFLEQLDDLRMDYMDLRGELYKTDPEHYNWFYKTDHHWNARAGFTAFRSIAGWLQENGFYMDPRLLDENNYTIENHENCFLGSWGQRTGAGFARAEDISMYVPDFETHVQPRWWEAEGTVDEVAYDRTVIRKEPEDIYDSLFANISDFINTGDTGNGKRILVLGDSFSRTVNPFLIIGFDEFYWYSNYDSYKLSDAYINYIKPDVVVMIMSGWNNFGSEDSFLYDMTGEH